MNNFWRVVRHAFRYRWTITGSLICSLGVAFLWGANLGTVYPFVQVVMDGETLNDWIDRRLADSQSRVETLTAEIKQLQTRITVENPPRPGRVRRRLQQALGELREWEHVRATSARIQPAIRRFAPSTSFRTLVLIVVLLLLGTFIKDLFLMGNMVLVERLAQLTTFDLRKLFYRRTLRMDAHAFGENRASMYVSLFTHDMQAVNSGIGTLFGRAIREPLKMLSCLVLAAFICWRLLLLSLVVSPLAIFVMRWLSRSVRRTNRRAMEEMSNLYGQLSESLTGIDAVKAYTMERAERIRFHHLAKQFMRRSMRIVSYTSLTKPCTEMIGVGVICLALLAGGYLVLNGETHLLGMRMSEQPLTLPALMAFFALLAGVSDPARKLAEIFNQLQRGLAAADRVFAMMDREPTIVSPAEPRPFPHHYRDLAFNNVSFHYHPEQPVLKHVSLRIMRNETLAIVGPNGCGKSTLSKLIPRFYDPVSGNIEIGGIDLRDLHLRQLRQRIGMVNQNTWLFDQTIMENIRYGSPHASDAEVIAAARRAHAHSFIEQLLDDGYQTIAGQGGQLLSGGQRQRISLARAILRDPEILILDEATSQIDLESEKLIHAALVDFIRDRTTFVITHRLSTLELADRIAVIEGGHVIDVGTHEQLLGRCPFYSRLHQIDLQESA